MEEMRSAIQTSAREKAREYKKKYNAENGFDNEAHALYVVTKCAQDRMESHMKAGSPMDIGSAMELAFLIEFMKSLIQPDKQ